MRTFAKGRPNRRVSCNYTSLQPNLDAVSCYLSSRSVPWFTLEGEVRSGERSETSLGALFVFRFRGLPQREQIREAPRRLRRTASTAYCFGDCELVVEIRRFTNYLGNTRPGKVVGEMAILRQSTNAEGRVAWVQRSSVGLCDGETPMAPKAVINQS